MRILVISDLPHFVTGGAEAQAARLIEAWLDDGHEVVCLGRRANTGCVQLGHHWLEVKRIHVINFLGRGARALTYFLSLAIQIAMRRRWADVIYCRFLGDAAATAAICKLMGIHSIPIVPTPANAGPDGDTGYLKSIPFSKALIRLLDRQCDAINLIAPQMLSDLKSAGFSRIRTTQIPNGIPLKRLEIFRAASEKLRAVCVGRLTYQKGYDVLIDAVSSSRELLKSLSIDVYGDGPLRKRLEGYAQDRGVSHVIRFNGELSANKVREQLAGSDLFLLPSRYEGMSNAALEAMEAACPVVLTACGGLDLQITASEGWVVPIGDRESLAAALVAATRKERSELQQMGKSCRRLVEQRYDIKVTARQYIRLFQSLGDEDCSNHS